MERDSCVRVRVRIRAKLRVGLRLRLRLLGARLVRPFGYRARARARLG